MDGASTRYIVFGAGAIGCTLGGLLQQGGAEVVFVALGAQLAALRTSGLRLGTPEREHVLEVQATDAVGLRL